MLFFGLFWGDWTLLLMIPAIIFTVIAQMKVKSTFTQYSKARVRSGMTGAEAARRLLDLNGLYDVPVERIRGELTDHYDPRSRKLRLSEKVYDSPSAAAIGVACHEAGHAVQHAKKYAPLALRMRIIPVCNIGSQLAMPLFFIGLILSNAVVLADGTSAGLGAPLMFAGILFFSLATFFQLVTLPVEFNASKRALQGIREHHLLAEEELPAAKKVLSAAAMTYVAALATSLLSLLRLILIARNSNRR